jgi:hypothetical protein
MTLVAAGIDSYLLSPAGELLRLEPPEPYIIGRDAGADVVIPSANASRRHCELRWDEETLWTAHDLGSLNGTWVNDQRLAEPRPLKDRDRLQVAGHQYTFHLLPSGADPAKLVENSQKLLKLIDTRPLAGTPPTTKTPSLTGKVRERALADLLHYFHLTRKTGRLMLADSEVSQLWVVNGVPRHALVSVTEGLEAIRELAEHSACQFAFYEGEEPPRRSIDGDTRAIFRDALGVQDLAATRTDARDLQKAKRLQQHLLARLPTVVGYEFAVYYEGLSGVSGDFYDVGTMADGSLLIVIGDVSGHGVQAAMVVTGLLKSLRALRRAHTDPVEMLTQLNDEVREDVPGEQFATLFTAKLEPATGQLQVVMAGHHPGYRFSRTADLEPARVGEAGMALGMAPGPEFRALLRSTTIRLEPGDALVQFTDGMLESERASGEIYGMDRIGESVRRHARAESLQVFADALAKDVHDFAKDVHDDLTVFAIARVGEPADDDRHHSTRIVRRRREKPAPTVATGPTEPLEGMADEVTTETFQRPTQLIRAVRSNDPNETAASVPTVTAPQTATITRKAKRSDRPDQPLIPPKWRIPLYATLGSLVLLAALVYTLRHI